LSTLSKVIFIVMGEETQRVVMLHGGTSHTSFAMTTVKGVFKGSNTGGNPLQKATMQNIAHTVKDFSILRKHASNSIKVHGRQQRNLT